MRNIILLIIAICICKSCIDKNKEYTKLTYKQLPSDVRKKFKDVYDYFEAPKKNKLGEKEDYMPPFAECYNLNKNCPCSIETKGGFITNPYFILTSCNKKSKISWEVLESVFIIKNDSIYYPYHTQKALLENGEEFDQVVGGATTYGKPRSYNVLIDTLNFRKDKIK